MKDLTYSIKAAHKQQRLDSLKVDSFQTEIQNGPKMFVGYEGKHPHDFYLRRFNGNIIMDSPAGPADQVMSVVESIAQREGVKLLIDSGDVPKEFKEALSSLGYKLIGNYYQK